MCAQLHLGSPCNVFLYDLITRIFGSGEGGGGLIFNNPRSRLKIFIKNDHVLTNDAQSFIEKCTSRKHIENFKEFDGKYKRI